MRAYTLVAILCPLFVGCASNKGTINSFTEPSFDPASMKSVAVLPIRNAKFAPAEAQQVNRRIAQTVSAAGVTVLGANEAIERLNSAGAADEWAVFLTNYTSSGVPNKTSLMRIADVLQVHGVLQGEVVNSFQQDGAYGNNKGQTRVTVRYSLLDGRSGLLVWEATADGICVTGTTLDDAPPTIEAINLAIEKIIEAIPFGQKVPPKG